MDHSDICALRLSAGLLALPTVQGLLGDAYLRTRPLISIQAASPAGP